MNTPLILKISAAILFGGFHMSPAAGAERKPDARSGKRAKPSATTCIGGSQAGGQGTVTFNNCIVWQGKVRGGLRTVAGSIDGQTYAAAWDGEELLWENVDGAAERLRGDLR